MTTWSIFNETTGAFVSTFSGPKGSIDQNVPAGHTAIEGTYDHDSQRVDIATGEVVDWQPPQPADDSDKTWAWDTVTKRWVSTPTLNAIKKAKWLELKAYGIALSQADITLSGYTFAADPATMVELMQKAQIAILAAQDGQVFSVDWETTDGTVVTMNQTQFKALLRAIDSRADTLKATARKLRSFIVLAPDEVSVKSIVWSSTAISRMEVASAVDTVSASGTPRAAVAEIAEASDVTDA